MRGCSECGSLPLRPGNVNAEVDLVGWAGARGKQPISRDRVGRTLLSAAFDLDFGWEPSTKHAATAPRHPNKSTSKVADKSVRPTRIQKLRWILICQLSILGSMVTFSLTELLGTPVFDTAGSRCGKVREVALVPQEDRARVAVLIIKTSTGDRLLPFASVTSINGGIRADCPSTDWAKGEGAEGMLLLGRDLLDQQVIDVFGRKRSEEHTSE